MKEPIYVDDLISPELSKTIDLMFEKLGVEILDQRIVQNNTKVYYVKMDLESGIDINAISKDRLEIFHGVLWAYIAAINTSDDKAIKLFEIVDDVISQSKPTHP